MAKPFQSPVTLDEAKARLTEAKVKQKEIESQLSDRNRLTADGERMIGNDYWTWRKSASIAHTAAMTEIIRLKQWIECHRDQVQQVSAAQLLVGCYRILRETDGLDDTDLAMLNLTESYLRTHGLLPKATPLPA